MNKIIIFIGTLQSGGAERIVTDISKMYMQCFQEVIVLTYYNEPIFYNIDKSIKLICIENKTNTKNKLFNAIWLRLYVKKEHPSVFLSFLMPFNIYSILSLMFIDVIKIVCERSDPKHVTNNALYRGFRNFIYNFCDKIQVQTINSKKYFPSKLQRKIEIIPNPNLVNLNEREKSLCVQKHDKIVSVGRLIVSKNHILLINAFSEIHKKFPTYILDIYGDGPMRKQMELYINKLDLQNCIKLHGTVSNIYEQLYDAKIFVMSSNYEGMPNALMEAMALGIPCVATDVSGVRDIITDGYNGFIINVGNVVDMQDKIEKLIISSPLRDKFIQNSISVYSDFNKENIYERWKLLVSK